MTPTPTSGAADLLAMVSKALRETYNLGQRYWQQADSEYISQHKKADDTRAKFLALVEETCAALAAGQATAAQQGAAYAALPTSSHAGRVYEEGFLIGTCPLYTADKMRAFADATHTLRASHGQAPAGAAEEIDKALNVYAQAFAARVNGWTRQNGDDLPGARSALFAAIHAYAQASTRPTTSPQAGSVQEEAALLDWLEQHDGRYYNLDKVAAIVGTGFLVRSEGNMPQVHSTLREAVYAARKQGASHDR